MESRPSRHCGLTMSQVTQMTRTGSSRSRPTGMDADQREQPVQPRPRILPSRDTSSIQRRPGLPPAASPRGARIVAVSSSTHLYSPVVFDDIHFAFRPHDPLLAYAQSKTANVLFAVDASIRWADDGITANAAGPGPIDARCTSHGPGGLFVPPGLPSQPAPRRLPADPAVRGQVCARSRQRRPALGHVCPPAQLTG
jgi:NAD(P)-dependent dehydrogenase (short-subunit alcohol dehydrogenase family)